MDDCLRKLGVSLQPENRERLSRYDALLRRYNPVLKMVKAEGDDLVVRHYADSFSGVRDMEKIASRYADPRIADLGSGAGLPGIPLALALPQYRFVLVERMQKRADFLRMCIESLDLGWVSVAGERLVLLKEKYEIVTCRAFHPFYDCEGEIASVLAPGGTVMLYKGRREKIDEEFRLVKGPWHFTAHAVSVPHLDAERALVTGTRIR